VTISSFFSAVPSWLAKGENLLLPQTQSHYANTFCFYSRLEAPAKKSNRSDINPNSEIEKRGVLSKGLWA
jgi:hypothetical protein